tara:strand:- start:166 stop:924 length:759 start_codon:yes stop_codon:yes gene_type:complete
MSVFSDFVRSVTGGRGVGETTGRAVGGFFGGPTGAEAGGKFGREASKSLDEFVGDADVSTAPSSAGVDSPATLSNLSQTSQVGRSFIDIDPRQGQGIGMNQSGLGFLAPLVTGASRALTTGVGRNIALGVGGTAIGGALTMFDGNGRKLIITRKMQREVKEMFMFMGGDLNATAQAYSNFKMRSYSADNILAIMLKKFSSQGPFVTKAAVRKTRSTLRKMKTLADMTSDLMPRKAPARRRASTTTTKLVRNG